ncbi:TetR/AcrR family transcriptional regulator [Roseovarius faecimaris]|uniref:TetR/AcrR family transcriptional regulator n=1 Tax=Roseovarius faecimaris TaxID=2494550 RepID=A0A6I6IWR4_9RHOB|nr:TetR/AcrR family transcriptional regulator [Roseovarius faecimaris]QGX99906.1 TetR/AcrR family transcriptional regulator [Roseovarius faecimaris]
MAGKTEERHDALRRKLVDIAETRMAEGGLSALKARDLAKEAGCALGAIYTVFDDLTHIALEVNGRTFRQLGRDVDGALQGCADASPTDRLLCIADAYLTFALRETRRWRSLFDVPFSPDLDVPQWYWDEMDRLFAHIAGPVGECFPDLSPADQALMTRALFSSVHGIVSLGIENRATPVPKADLSRMIELLVRRTTGNA